MSEWISVKDRLPERKGKYLVTWLWAYGTEYENKYVDVVFFRGKTHWAKFEKYITHWMPLPDPPKEN